MAVALAALAVTPSYVRAYRVGGASEAPSYLVGDLIVVNKAAYDIRLPYTPFVLLSHSQPAPSEMVMFRRPGEKYVVFKRILGCPGDTIAFADGRFTINGVELDYVERSPELPVDVADANNMGTVIEKESGYGFDHLITRSPGSSGFLSPEPFVVPEGHYYLVGDNRDVSLDSRTYGPIPRANILGKVSGLLHRPTSSTGSSVRQDSPDEDWPRSTPEAQGLDPEPLDELVTLMREGERFPDLHSLLIVKNGYLVLEEYFAGWNATRLHTLQSVSKSFTSALIGIAIERGEIESVDEHVIDFFPQWRDELAEDPRWAAQRVEDLLTMRTGTDYHERGEDSPHFQLNRTPTGWDRFYLDRPMVTEPGKYWQYDSGGVILLSALLKQRSGMHADAYADKYLFAPLGIERTAWFRNREGHPHTGGGLSLLPQDMAKFGLLYLRGGRWGDQQVVPEWWVETSARRHFSFPPGRGHRVGYGYLWWILEPDPDGEGEQDIYAAMGFRAQYIFVVPEHDMVVVVTGGTQNGTDQGRPVGFLYSHILPAVKR
jgi:signal peptidase I